MRTVLVALALAAGSLLHGQERTLSWTALDVGAKLENDGTLRISERHRMLFDGNWNGGERIFRREPGQLIELRGMSRVEEDGQTHPMAEATGDGIGLHEYRFDGRTLRWRAREASDPPFRNAERLYVIDYTLRGVVRPEGESYALDHDFALVDRPGPIESFSVTLELDSGWQAPPDFVPVFSRTNLPPGQGAILKLQLKWVGEGTPAYLGDTIPARRVAATPRPVAPAPPPPSLPMPVKLPVFGAFVAVAVVLMRSFFRHEEGVGRYEPPPHVTPEWLEEHLLVHRAEVVGAAWDGATGAGEVAALIAVMTAEGKIENVAGAPKLRLLVPRKRLSDYERGFVDALFINGDEIDPETLRLHYRQVGFRPEATIAGPLTAAARKLVGGVPVSSWIFGIVALVVTLFVFPIVAVAFAVTLLLVTVYRRSLSGREIAKALPLPLLAAALLHTYLDASLGSLGVSLFAGGFLLWLALRFASWRDSDIELRNLRNFRAARQFLLQRILGRDPEVDPRWIPYMLAFGLVPDDRWSVTPVRRPVQRDSVRGEERPVAGVVDDSRGSGQRNTPAFEAGGGRFGGAGATGSWASIRTFASAVAATPAPSTSSSDYGSSGSGWSWSSSDSSSSDSSSSSSWGSSSSSSSSSHSSSSGGGGGGGW